jgi:hypothetical protein
VNGEVTEQMPSVVITDMGILCFYCTVVSRHVICTKCRSIDCHPNGPSKRSAGADLGCKLGNYNTINKPSNRGLNKSVTYFNMKSVAQLALVV